MPQVRFSAGIGARSGLYSDRSIVVSSIRNFLEIQVQRHTITSFTSKSLRRREAGAAPARSWYLVTNLVRPVRPLAKTGQRFFAHDLNGRDAPLGKRPLQFAVDERIVETDFGGVLGGVGEI